MMRYQQHRHAIRMMARCARWPRGDVGRTAADRTRAASPIQRSPGLTAVTPNCRNPAVVISPYRGCRRSRRDDEDQDLTEADQDGPLRAWTAPPRPTIRHPEAVSDFLYVLARARYIRVSFTRPENFISP
jgi:hypothetical protein